MVPEMFSPMTYTHLNEEFQRIARRDKKAFLGDQCKEIEGNNRMGKSSDLFKKIRDTNGTFHAKMGSIKDRNGRDLTEAEDIMSFLKLPGSTFSFQAQTPTLLAVAFACHSQFAPLIS